ncbi:MAG: DNA mismatch repair endonuclease MutL, partial [Thermaurantiacus sp.]
MSRIRRLPTHLVDRIAAGEVVERPASVVKELVENALDAGARSIRIELEGAGRSRILVADDGCGMAPDEMRLALERHATSKLPSDDLMAIHSFGFRGEALPAIASVARLTMVSRPAAAVSAWQLVAEPGGAIREAPAAAPQGTRLVIEDLFARVPARAKFLKTDRTEVAAVADAVRRLAMANPAAGFHLSHEGRQLLAVQALPAGGGVEGLLARVRALLPEGVDSVPVDLFRDGFRLGGLAGLPSASRATADQQYLFVNGRPVRDRLLVGALRGAYRDRLPAGRHPLAVLFLDVPTSEVDVNVHPAKTEVRFRDAALVRGLIVSGVRAGLDSETLPASAAAGHALERALAPGLPMAAEPHFVPDGVAEPQLAFALPPAARAPTRAAATRDSAPVSSWPLGVARGQIAGTYIVAE